MHNIESKNPVGRPKTLDRALLIDIAINEYWLHGINNVSLSKIANIAKVSRPGIYKEFSDEDYSSIKHSSIYFSLEQFLNEKTKTTQSIFNEKKKN